MKSTAMTTTNGQPEQAIQRMFTVEDITIIKEVIAKGATDAELKVFLAICERTGLDPFTKQIYCIKRWDFGEGKNVMTPQVSIDGYRILAERTGKYVGFIGPQWCGADGVWSDVWLSNDPPKAARFGVQKEGVQGTIWAVARWGSYVQKTKDGKPLSTWEKMPDVMLGNAAERIALRRAFPYDLSCTGAAVSEPETAEESVDAEIVDEAGQGGAEPAAEEELASAEDHAVIDDLLRQYKGLPIDADVTSAKAGLTEWVTLGAETDPSKLTKVQAETAIERLRQSIAAAAERLAGLPIGGFHAPNATLRR